MGLEQNVQRVKHGNDKEIVFRLQWNTSQNSKTAKKLKPFWLKHAVPRVRERLQAFLRIGTRPELPGLRGNRFARHQPYSSMPVPDSRARDSTSLDALVAEDIQAGIQKALTRYIRYVHFSDCSTLAASFFKYKACKY